MQGDFLVAHPLLMDGYFKRSVVYLTEDNDEGTLGFVLNFKTDLMLRDVMPQVKNGNFPIFEGGPVSKNQLYYIHNLGHNLSESIRIQDNLYWGGDFFELLHMIDHGQVKTYDVRFFVGYSGWSPGQLKEELREKAWFNIPAEPQDVLRRDHKNLWGEELSKVKGSYRLFSDMGFDVNPN
jgi:putative transcriptional regulator